MIWLSLISAALASLWHHRMRSLLTMLGMVFGVGAVVAMMAISEGARVQAMESLRTLGVDNVILKSRKPAVTAQSNTGGGRRSIILSYGLTFADAERLTALLPDLIDAVPVREVREKVWNGDARVDARILAIDDRIQGIAGLTAARGRLIIASDNDELSGVAVIGARLADELFRLRDALGAEIKVGSQWWRIVGVLAPAGNGGPVGTLAPAELDRAILIPETTARLRHGLMSFVREQGSSQGARIELDALVLRFAPGTDVVARGLLAKRTVDPRDDRGDLDVVVPVELIENQRRTQAIFAIVMGSIASISLIVGGIGIMNIMLATVLERTREIGIRRAIGARRRDILAQFLVETVALSLLGGLAGLAAGIGGAILVSSLAGWPTLVTATSVLLALGICVAVGVAFGLYPAAKASRMQPVEALRHG